MLSFDRRGITLLVLCVGVIVTAISLTVVIPRADLQVIRTREDTLRFQLSEFRRAVDKFIRFHQRQPESIDELLRDDQGNRFLRRAYIDPFTGSADWIKDQNAEGKTFFRSASEEKSISGTIYSQFR